MWCMNVSIPTPALWAPAMRLNEESERDWIAREQDCQLREKRLESEISRLKAEKVELEQQELRARLRDLERLEKAIGIGDEGG